MCMCEFSFKQIFDRVHCAALLLLVALLQPAAFVRAEAPAATKPVAERKILVMEVKGGEEVGADLAPALTDLVTGRVAQAKSLSVISSSEISQVLGLEGKKQLLGCSQNACLTDIANTMGARYVIFGRVNALGRLKVVQLRLFDASEARFLQRMTLRGEDIVALSDQIPASVDSLIGGLLDPSERRALLALRPESSSAAHKVQASRSQSEAESSAQLSPLLLAGVGSLGVGLALAATTGFAGYYYNNLYSNPALPYAQRDAAKNTGTTALVAGGVASLALLGIGAVLVLFGW